MRGRNAGRQVPAARLSAPQYERMLAQLQILSQARVDDIWQVLGEFKLPAAPGLERQALARVEVVIEPLHLSPAALERVRAAVSTAAGNTLAASTPHGPRLPVTFRVLATSGEHSVPPLPAGGRTAAGCGFFVVQKLASRWPTGGGVVCHTIEVFLCPTANAPLPS